MTLNEDKMSKGKIITMGGNVDLTPDTPLFKEYFNIAQQITENAPKIGIIPTASANSRKSGKEYVDLFESMGADTILIDPKDREETKEEEMISKVQEAETFFLTGGHQLRITSMLGGTPLLKEIHRKFEDGALLGGTSAGSVCMATIMISQDLIRRPFVHGEVELTQGLGFLEDITIDTHFAARNRIPRLIHIVSENPGVLGVGIGENTGTIWNLQNKEFKVVGRGSIVVIEGKDIVENNAPSLEIGDSISVSGIKVHVMGNGSIFDYDECKLYLPQEE